MVQCGEWSDDVYWLIDQSCRGDVCKRFKSVDACDGEIYDYVSSRRCIILVQKATATITVALRPYSCWIWCVNSAVEAILGY